MVLGRFVGRPPPSVLPPPPRAWAGEVPAMATEAGISTTDLDEAFTILDAFRSQLQPLDQSDD